MAPADSQDWRDTRAGLASSGVVRALVLDDDGWACNLIRCVLEEAVPGIEIEERREPDITGHFDIYVVDNDFDGARRATQIVSAIRDREPKALIVAFSATLDRGTLKELLNAGCNAALEKGRPNDLDSLSRVAQAYAVSPRTRGERVRFTDTVKAIRDLIGEWNVRLAQEESDANHA